jgi:cyclic beta-1,2-glucan synthetase
VVHFLQRLRGLGPAAAAAVEWLEDRLSDRQTCTADILRREHRRQAANQVSVGNCVTSLRLLSALDWTVFFERTSLVEAILRDDPSGVYARQDFATRDRYRRIVEQLARSSSSGELGVARRSLTLAVERERRTAAAPETTTGGARAWPAGAHSPEAHVGYFLIDRGRAQLEADLHYRPRLRESFRKMLLALPQATYFGGLLVLLGLILAGLVSLMDLASTGAGMLLCLLAVALLPASELAVGVINYLVTLVLPPRVLPKLDFKDGIPSDCATFVVMPTMLLRPESAAVLLERLEVHFLSNLDPHLYFALLTDFADAPIERMPEDEGYVRDALAGVKALNQRYCSGGPERFFLFHRRRLWNEVEQCWMGWERKRGKLVEFNRLLRGARDTTFAVSSVAPAQLHWVRYVITLDADTRLPREAALRLIGTLAHPLNRAHFDPAQGRVVEGYGVLQPRVSLRLTAATRSLFARIFAGSAGIDPYTVAVSDVYQDLFGVGSFTGKGVYDVDAFEASAGHAFPENHILSHDLIEGNYARCGLVTDIELLDDFPTRYHAFAQRIHRWVRGDWQILPWLLRRVPCAPANQKQGSGVRGRGSGTRRNTLPLVERWKIADNLRRSLVPPALVLLLVLGWLVAGSFWVWTAFALAVLGLPLVLQIGGAVLSSSRNGRVLPQVRELRAELPATAGQVLLSLVFLADQAVVLVDAIARTLYRLTVSRRHLLEWETAASADRRLGTAFTAFWLNMWPATALGLVVAAAVSLLRPDAAPAAMPILFAWCVSPAVAYWVSRPRRPAEVPLTPSEASELRRLARKTWGFFESFVGDEDHWLPPDNYQEDPKNEVAHRTSPTNAGLWLLSALAAHDLGYLGLTSLLDRLEKSFATFDHLERFQGHFLNWYDTRTLRPLQPGYISTVDSGNLVGCLLALKQGLREKIEEPIAGPALRDGLVDTLSLVKESLEPLESAATVAGQPPDAGTPLEPLWTTTRALARILDDTPVDLRSWGLWLQRLEKLAAPMPAQVQALSKALDEVPDDLQRWVERFTALVHDQRAQLAALAPWLEHLPDSASYPSASACPPGSVAYDFWHRWQRVFRTLVTPTGIADVHLQVETILEELGHLERQAPEIQRAGVSIPALAALGAAVRETNAPAVMSRCQHLADRAAALASDMDFRFLYNEQRQLFSTGYNLAAGRLDSSHYDLLASEARLASFLAIARGDAGKRHWFQLARPITSAGGTRVLLSWGGTMFEYLMPRLLLRGYAGTLLEEACRGAVAQQIAYARHYRVPWGISESAFGALDGALDYQYQSFGVPGLGLKRGLALDLVIAPYATALAALIGRHAALHNFRRLAAEGALGPFGFYEAIDYTRDRLQKKRSSLVVRSYMAHHQGMTLVALANCLLNNPMPRRFHAEPMVRATELLLQERMPLSAPIVKPHRDEVMVPAQPVMEDSHPMSRRLTTAQTPAPRTHLLSSGQYSMMITNAGSGYSVCRGLDVTRWREDRTRDAAGQFIYVRDLRSGLVWSGGHQPVCRPADEYEVVFSSDKAEFRRTDAGIETHLEIAVSPEKFAEVRRLTFTNHNSRPHDIEVTSYVEPVLAPRGADVAHPAFGKLFLETEFLPGPDALLCRRRPRSDDQKPIWGVHVMALDSPGLGRHQYETDRARFLGRGRTPANPAAMERGAVLSGRTGAVLDPVFSLRQRLRITPSAAVTVAFTTAVADSREEAHALADQFCDPHAVTRAFELAWAHSQVELRHLRLSAEESHLFQRLAASILYAGTPLCASAAVLAANHQGQPGLWRYGISGDKPIVLAFVAEEGELQLIRQLLAAHTYWRLKGLEVDLVILNEHPTGYFEEFHQQLQALVRGSDAHALLDKPGGVFLRKTAHISEEDKVLLQAAARVVLHGNRGSLAAQVDRNERQPPLPARLVPTRRRGDMSAERNGGRARAPALLFANGLGGFSADGREYVLFLGEGAGLLAGPTPSERLPPPRPGAFPAQTPAPWINVVANPSLGFLVSESGSGYTWAGNSQTNRLTPWSNDPVADPPGEVLYLRDEDTGDFWTPTPLPCGAASASGILADKRPASLSATQSPLPAFTCRHGQGYTIFEHHSHGLAQELLLCVPPADPIKLLRLTVRNESGETRRLSATFYAEWVLGTARDQAPLHVVTEVDSASGGLMARNAFNMDYAGWVVFADVNLRPRTLTGDRAEFLGRNGSVSAPAAMERVELSGRVGAALDPCAALRAPFTLQPHESREIVFLLGASPGAAEARQLMQRYRAAGQVRSALDAVRRRWDDLLGAVQVRTPNPALDLLLNRWLLYQVLSCRVWARSAFYQSGGAYGFRDQLQDVMALVYGAPQETRAQILRAAARQFLEGDVQHWWHPPAGKGVRTRFSDDFLWLPLVVCHYVTTTGDAAILDEHISFLKAPLLKPEQEEDYGSPETTAEAAPLYDHCVRALEHGSRYGVHGLPLMGTGDWNDGMNRVGAGGKGESVWDAWFQIYILSRFAPLAEARGDQARANLCREQAERLHAAVEERAWDGRWYRRAYFDDGTPLGSNQNDECKIDSIAQSWAVIAQSGVSRAGSVSDGLTPNPSSPSSSLTPDPRPLTPSLDRARQALAAVDEMLVRRHDRLVLLFTPPFDKGAIHPGYIKGYVPGIRENGGQYTHAATWVVQATALLGQGQRAMELFDLLNPIHHAANPEGVERYRVEPYVVAADVYSEAPHTGRGGWTWYTGSAAWLYRVALESLLGFHLTGNRLRLAPCVPGSWPRFEITYRYRSATYHIAVENPDHVERGVQRLLVDGTEVPAGAILLEDDARTHEVRVLMG